MNTSDAPAFVARTTPGAGRLFRAYSGFRTPKGRFLRVVAAGGKEKWPQSAKLYLDGRTTRPLDDLIVNIDRDDEVGAASLNTPTPSARIDASFMSHLERIEGEVPKKSGLGFVLNDGLTVSPLVWFANDAATNGVPAKQTLERLVSTSLAEANPARAQAVEEWLASRPEPPPGNGKEYAWSYLAGWAADDGLEAFYSLLWKREAVVAKLQERLAHSGAWQLISSLLD